VPGLVESLGTTREGGLGDVGGRLEASGDEVGAGVGVAACDGVRLDVGLGVAAGDDVGAGVGFDVGAGVGFDVAVGLGVGVAVGFGAGLDVPPATSTTTVPCMNGWSSQ